MRHFRLLIPSPPVENSTDMKMTATTLFGLEDVLAAELLKLGARQIEKYNRAVSFTGDLGFMYKANLCLRTALRILLPIRTFYVKNENHLYDEIKTMDWENYLDVNGTLAVDSAINTELFSHSQFISQKTKDAVVDRFREKFGKRPSVDLDNPSLKINIHVYKTLCTVSLDSSGMSLHKRGYRESTNLAPLNEALAAGMVLLSDWDKRSNFIDPMTGSGTLAIEAALIAANIPPGYFRSDFCFKRWKNFDQELYDLIYESCIKKITNHKPNILASDLSFNVLKKSRENAKSAKVDDMIAFRTSSFENLERPSGNGVIVMNPPYGERMNKDDISQLYKSIGDTLKRNWSGYSAWLITSNMEGIKEIGLRPSRKITLYNGKLECKFLKFEMYEGTKKVHKLVKGEK